jgi:hypothetical protein
VRVSVAADEGAQAAPSGREQAAADRISAAPQARRAVAPETRGGSWPRGGGGGGGGGPAVGGERICACAAGPASPFSLLGAPGGV